MEDNMNVKGVSGAGVQPGVMGMGAGEQMDAVSKDLQNQIENLQKQMKELSSNQEMPMEAKMKKRQELQKQISDLEVQLRQHQMEVKREAAMKKREETGSMDDLMGTRQQTAKKDSQGTGMSLGSMEALISADTSMKQASVHGSTARKMEGRAGVLKAEIALDSSRGGNVDLKKEELAKTEAIAEQATASQMEAFAQAGKTVQEAAKDEQTGKAGKTNKTDKTDEDGQKEGEAKTGEEEAKAASEENTFDVEMLGVPFSRGYNPVDVRL